MDTPVSVGVRRRSGEVETPRRIQRSPLRREFAGRLHSSEGGISGHAWPSHNFYSMAARRFTLSSNHHGVQHTKHQHKPV